MRVGTLVIVNDGLGPNKGDQAILASMLEAMRDRIPDAATRAFPNSRMTSLGQYLEFARALRNADLLLFGGGQGIQDHASVAFLISGLLKILLARLLSRPVMCYGLGVGPLATLPGRLLSRAILNRVDLITVRDETSREQLTQLGITRPLCVVTADPALALTPAKEDEVRDLLVSEGIEGAKGPRIAIAPRRWFHYRHYLLPMSLKAKLRRVPEREEFARLKRIIADVADHLVTRHGAQVIFVPMTASDGKIDPGQDDDIVSREIIGLMRCHKNAILLRGDHPPALLKGFFGKMDLVIGMRMHALILASMMGIPVVGISLSPKFPPFFSLIGQSDYLLAVEEVGFHDLLDRVTMALANLSDITRELRSRVPAAQRLALSNVSYVQQMLEGCRE
jgi:polysaccharide pyruvyl transferase WcaK-like protein